MLAAALAEAKRKAELERLRQLEQVSKPKSPREVIMKSDPLIECPPNGDNRLFNENDVLGEVDRDEHGLFVHMPIDATAGEFEDKNKKLINHLGYRIKQPTGDVIDNLNGRVAFPKNKLDPKTHELPHPFNWERYNFNPHHLIGDFNKTPNGDFDLKNLPNTSKGFPIDKRGRRVNKHGWLVADNKENSGPKADIIDKNGRKKLDKAQTTDDGDIPKLYNLKG